MLGVFFSLGELLNGLVSVKPGSVGSVDFLPSAQVKEDGFWIGL